MGRTILNYVLSATCTSYEKIPISLACLQIRLHRQKSLSVARYAYVFFACTLESASCVIDMGIFSTMYMIRGEPLIAKSY